MRNAIGQRCPHNSTSTREASLRPQFLLRRWCDAQGRVQSFRVVNGHVAANALAPEYTSYEDDLYAVGANQVGVEENHLERRLFGPIDSDAAVALGKIERREAITPDDKIAWAFFLNSLRVRKPDVLGHLRAEGLAMLRALLAQGDAALPEGWPSSEQWLEAHYPGLLETQNLISNLSRIVLHDELTLRFHELNWWVMPFKAEAPKLLLSDLPIHWEGGLTSDDFSSKCRSDRTASSSGPPARRPKTISTTFPASS